MKELTENKAKEWVEKWSIKFQIWCKSYKCNK